MDRMTTTCSACLRGKHSPSTCTSPYRLPPGYASVQEASEAKGTFERGLFELTCWKALKLAGPRYTLSGAMLRQSSSGDYTPEDVLRAAAYQKVITERYSIPAETLQAWREEHDAEQQRANEEKNMKKLAEEQRVAALFAEIIAPPRT
jgi:hypothetical protein